MVVIFKVESSELADLVKQIQAGNEVLLTQADKPIARLTAICETRTGKFDSLHVRSIKGHQILTPVVHQAELADDLFEGQL